MPLKRFLINKGSISGLFFSKMLRVFFNVKNSSFGFSTKPTLSALYLFFHFAWPYFLMIPVFLFSIFLCDGDFSAEGTLVESLFDESPTSMAQGGVYLLAGPSGR